MRLPRPTYRWWKWLLNWRHVWTRQMQGVQLWNTIRKPSNEHGDEIAVRWAARRRRSFRRGRSKAALDAIERRMVSGRTRDARLVSPTTDPGCVFRYRGRDLARISCRSAGLPQVAFVW